MAKGACNCGAIRFNVDAKLSEVFVCHCSICRRATGSNGIAVVIVDKDQFRWTKGSDCIREWKKPDADWAMSFCKLCGSPVPGANDGSSMFIPAGALLDGAETLKVRHHIWVNSKAAWDEIGDKGLQHPEAFKA